MAKNETYEEFVDKFKPRKTTDDCYTPKPIYDAIKNWVTEEYDLKNVEVVRPFFPGGDYENFEYSSNCVVIDNPPFSILSKILKFYSDNKIKFFLFAPHLTLFSSLQEVSYIVTYSKIEYENGAKVVTSFITNLENNAFIRTAPLLKKLIKDSGEKAENKKPRPKFKYPTNLITSAGLGKISDFDFTISRNQCCFMRGLEEQKKMKKEIYGGGFLICDEKAEEIKEIKERKESKESTEITIQLSQKEKEIITKLNNE